MVSASHSLLVAGPILSVALVIIGNAINALLNDALLGRQVARLFGIRTTFFATNTCLHAYAWRQQDDTGVGAREQPQRQRFTHNESSSPSSRQALAAQEGHHQRPPADEEGAEDEDAARRREAHASPSGRQYADSVHELDVCLGSASVSARAPLSHSELEDPPDPRVSSSWDFQRRRRKLRCPRSEQGGSGDAAGTAHSGMRRNAPSECGSRASSVSDGGVSEVLFYEEQGRTAPGAAGRADQQRLQAARVSSWGQYRHAGGSCSPTAPAPGAPGPQAGRQEGGVKAAAGDGQLRGEAGPSPGRRRAACPREFWAFDVLDPKHLVRTCLVRSHAHCSDECACIHRTPRHADVWSWLPRSSHQEPCSAPTAT